MAFRIKFTMDNGTWFKTRNLENVESFDTAKAFVNNIDGGEWLESWEGIWFMAVPGKTSSIEILEED